MIASPAPDTLEAMRIELTLAMQRALHLGHDEHHGRLKDAVRWVQDVEREQRHLDQVARVEVHINADDSAFAAGVDRTVSEMRRR